MKYDISKFEELVDQGYLRKSEKDNLILFNYTDQCVFDREWTELTRIARGLILNKDTGFVVAHPFPKFFNLGEMEETFLFNLPDLPYTVSEKVDGSLGIIFYHEGEWDVATRGSFYSDQAIKAKEIMQKYNLDYPTLFATTLLVEIIYPENKIVVNYGKEEKLVLLGAYDKITGGEYHPNDLQEISLITGLPIAERYNYTIERMIELQKVLPKDQEGFVVRFENGLRVKIKGNEYLKIAKILANASPISFWEAMEGGIVNRTYLAQLPEEFRKQFDPIVDTLENQYKKVALEIENAAKLLPTRELTHEGKRTVGLFLKDNTTFKHKSAMFPLVLGQATAVNNYIMDYIRPDANVLKAI